MARRPVLLTVGDKFTTRVTNNDGTYYELVVTVKDASQLTCTLTRFAAAGSTGPFNYSGKYTVVGNAKLVAVLKDDSLGFSVFKLVIRSHEFSPLKDRIRIIPKDIDSILDAKDNTSGFVTEERKLTEDPEAESFQRQALPSAAPTTGGATNKTNDQPGNIVPGSVIVKRLADMSLYAFDDGSGALKDCTSNTTVGSIAYAATGTTWNATISGTQDVCYIEALRR